MTCQNCALQVQNALQSVPGVASAWVDRDAGRAMVRMSAAQSPDAERLMQVVRGAGFDVSLPHPTVDAMPGTKAKKASDLHWRSAVFLGAPVTVMMMIAEWGWGWGMHHTYHWVALGLTLPVQILVGWQFYQGAWRQLKVGRSNMDTLVSLGSTAAFGFSVWALFTHYSGHLFFMEAAGILTLISVGHWLEARMSVQAGASLKALLSLAPQTARRRNPDQTETAVAVAELQIGDRIALRPGDRVPVDLEVIEGDSSVDESMLTGEAIPVEKGQHARLFTGTTNLSGSLLARVTATGESTVLAQIIAAVERAQSSRAEIQRLADRISSVFVPVVVVIALATAVFWGTQWDTALAVHNRWAPWLWTTPIPSTAGAAAFVMMAAVLIVACPCAMGLATPAALMAGVNAAARRGILIRDAQALEKSGRVDTVIFDKTGTLTSGHPQVVEVWESTPGAIPLKPRIGSLARGSQHPLSKALQDWAGPEAIGTPIAPGWRELRGSGVEARGVTPEGSTCQHRLGSEAWMKTHGVNLESARQWMEHWTTQGTSVLFLAEDQQLRAAFALRDSLKPGAKEMVQQLQNSGLRVGMLTGDHMRTATALGAELGIPPEWISAGVRPEEKAEALRALQRQGNRVAFVGDGLNDGPALAQADLGIAVTRATDVAKEAADILLLKSDLAAIPEALQLAQATLSVIRQNLFWAFFYNAAFIPLAALGFLSPMLSAVAMAASDILVLGNALRLRHKK